MKVLNVGCTGKYLCNDPLQTFAGRDIDLVCMDVDPASNPDYLQDITKPIPEDMRAQFDVVYMSHVLEHVARAELAQTLLNCQDLLKPGGKFYVFVPCLEWACDQVLQGNETIVVQGALYGGQTDAWDVHKIAFSLNALKELLERCGFKIETAGVGKYISVVNGKQYECFQNVVVGVKGESHGRL